MLIVTNLRETVQHRNEFEIEIIGKSTTRARHSLSPRQVQIMLAGGLVNGVRAKHATAVGRPATA